jgi:hypothetical protein
MSRYILSSEAKADLRDIRDYIARGNPNRAVSFVEELIERLQRLAERPLMGRSRDERAWISCACCMAGAIYPACFDPRSETAATGRRSAFPNPRPFAPQPLTSSAAIPTCSRAARISVVRSEPRSTNPKPSGRYRVRRSFV